MSKREMLKNRTSGGLREKGNRATKGRRSERGKENAEQCVGKYRKHVMQKPSGRGMKKKTMQPCGAVGKSSAKKEKKDQYYL